MPERKEPRKKGYYPINVYDIDRPYSAISINYSECGLGMITNLDIFPGDHLIVSCDLYWPRPKKAVVIWTSPISSSSKKAGLSLC